MVQTWAARLRKIYDAQTPDILINTPRQRTKQGCPAVIYDMHDYLHTLIVDWKYTLDGKFTTTMSKVELIWKTFIQQTQLSGGKGKHCTVQY